MKRIVLITMFIILHLSGMESFHMGMFMLIASMVHYSTYYKVFGYIIIGFFMPAFFVLGAMEKEVMLERANYRMHSALRVLDTIDTTITEMASLGAQYTRTDNI